MKKIIFAIIAVFIFFTNCEKDRKYDGPWFVHVDKESLTVSESGSALFKVVVSAPVSGSLTVDFELSGSAQRGVDYELNVVGNTLTFPEGTGSLLIEVTSLDNFVQEPNKDVTFTLATNSAGYLLGTPGPDGRFQSTSITILDNDCPFEPGNWEGNASGVQDGVESPFTCSVSEIISEDVIKINVTGILHQEIADWWGTSFAFGGVAEVTLDNTDPANPLAIIEPQYYGQDADGYDYWISQNTVGTGSFSICSKTITLPYMISWTSGYEETVDAYTVVITMK